MSDKKSVPSTAAAQLRALPTPFVVRQSATGPGAAWIYLAGELDFGTAPQLEQALGEVAEGARLVVLDLRELTFLDSAGIHVIVDAGIRAGRAGCRLVAVRGPTQVDAAFSLIGITEDVEILVLDPTRTSAQSLLRLVPEPPQPLASRSGATVSSPGAGPARRRGRP